MHNVPNEVVKRAVGEAAFLELLAEEASELAQASLKLARVIRGENPTPVTKEEAMKNLSEECVDVCLCIQTIGIPYDASMESYKRTRLIERLIASGRLKVEQED